MNEDIQRFRTLLEGVPKLKADWRGTNHYELARLHPEAGESLWWLDLFADCDWMRRRADVWEETEVGQCLGFLLDLAEAGTCHLPALLTELEQLRALAKRRMI